MIDPAGMRTRQDVLCPPAGSAGRFMGIFRLWSRPRHRRGRGFAFGVRDGEFMGGNREATIRIHALRAPGALESGTP